MNAFKNLKNASFNGGPSIFAADTGSGHGRRTRRLGVGTSTPAKAKTAKYAIENPAALHREFMGAGSPFLKYKAFFMGGSVDRYAPAVSRPNDKLAKKIKKKANLPIIPTLHPASPWLVDIIGQSIVYARRRALAHALARAVLTPPRSAGLLTEKATVGVVPEDEKSYYLLTAPKKSLTLVNTQVLRVQAAIAKQLVLELPAAFAKANSLHIAAHNHLQVVVYARPPSVKAPSPPLQMLITPRGCKLKACFVQVGFAKMIDLELSGKFCKANGLRPAAVNHLQVVAYSPLRLPVPSDVGSTAISPAIIICLPRPRPVFPSPPVKDADAASIESNDAFLASNGPTSLEVSDDSTEVGQCLPITVKLPPAKDHLNNCPLPSTAFGILANIINPEAHHSPATEAEPAKLFIVSAESLRLQHEQCLVQQDYASGPNIFEVMPKNYDDQDNSIDRGTDNEDLWEDKAKSVNEDNVGDQDPPKGRLGDSSTWADDRREFGIGLIEVTKEMVGQSQDDGLTSEFSNLLNEGRLQGGSSSPATGASIQVLLSEIGCDHDLSPSHRRSRDLHASIWSYAATPLEDVFEPTPTASSQRSLTSLIWACEDLLGSAGTTNSGRQYDFEDDGKAGDQAVTEHSQDDWVLVERKLAMDATPMIQGYIDETAHPSPPAARTISSDASKDTGSLIDSATSSDGSSQESYLPSKRSFPSSIWSRRSFSFNSRQALSSMMNRVPRSESTPQRGQGGKETWKVWKAGKIRGRKVGVREDEANKENELEGSGGRKWRKVVDTLKRAAGSAK